MSRDETPAGDADGGDGESASMFRLTHSKVLLLTVLFVGIAGTGLLRRFLGELGYNGVGRIVFILGYGGMVLIVWYGWVRPIDITGPDGR